MSKTKRKTRSDKFPLTLHSTGQLYPYPKGQVSTHFEELLPLSPPDQAIHLQFSDYLVMLI